MVADSSTAGTAENGPPGAIDHQAIDDRRDGGQLRGEPLTERWIAPQLLRLDAADDSLSIGHQRIEVGSDWMSR